MFKNYIKTAIRNLMRNKLHTIINISGLSIGIAVSILILSYVWFELSFDRFHSKFDRIYRVVMEWSLGTNEEKYGGTGSKLAITLKDEFPEVLYATRIRSKNNLMICSNRIEYIENESSLIMADNDIFKIFDIELVLGNPETALEDPNSIVLTEKESEKFFGKEYPIGKLLTFKSMDGKEEGIYTVTGIAKALPPNSHFKFNYIIPFEKSFPEYYSYSMVGTYITLPRDYSPENFDNKLKGIVEKYINPRAKAGTDGKPTIKYKLYLQPLKYVHFSNGYREFFMNLNSKGNLFQIRMYLLVGLFILILACINFITLSSVRSGNRTKEVGMRKVSGANQRQLIIQFLTESVIISIIALFLAILIVLVLNKPLNNLLDIKNSNSNTGKIIIMTILCVITFFVGITGGSYPAFFLSTFKPVNLLKGKLLKNTKDNVIRNGLVVFQFVVSAILIISSIVIFRQYTYMQNKDLGVDRENILIVQNIWRLRHQGTTTLPFNEQFSRQITLKQEVLKHPNVINASYMCGLPCNWPQGYNRQHDINIQGVPNEITFTPVTNWIDCEFVDVFGMNLAAGRNFKKELTPPQLQEGVLINETAEKYFGQKDIAGKYISYPAYIPVINDNGEREYVQKQIQTPVIGVIKDFQTTDFRQENIATLFFPLVKDNFGPQNLAVRLKPGNLNENIDVIRQKWNEVVPDQPFTFTFFDKILENQYNKEKKLKQVFTFFTALAIFIACLGIFGLAAFTTEQRTKEIGIRKVIGASVVKIIIIITKLYLILTLSAVLIAYPIGYFIMNRWLNVFTSHIEIGISILLFTMILSLIIVISTVSYHSIKAALTNPAESLKYE